MKYLHLASFSGNIGDAANHRGFYKNFHEYIDSHAQFVPCEIRQFYKSWHLKEFDDSFADYANLHDALVIGGGNFFEICWDYSATGTTIDISDAVLDKIKVPILINGIGFDDSKGYTSYTENAFGHFLSSLLERENCRVSVRNDGSMAMLKRHYDDEITLRVDVVPDGGFFYRPEISAKTDRKKIGICMAKDQINRRFGGTEEYRVFLRNYARFLVAFLENAPDYSIVFVPHIFSDIGAIYDLLEYLPDIIRRNKIEIAGCNATDISTVDAPFAEYLGCDLVISMRFHGNVVPIGNSIPTLGTVSFEKHMAVYEEIGIKNQTILTSSPYFFDKLPALVQGSLENKESLIAQYIAIGNENKRQISNVYKEWKEWLDATGQYREH